MPGAANALLIESFSPSTVSSLYCLRPPSDKTAFTRHFFCPLSPSTPKRSIPCHPLFISAFMLASKVMCLLEQVLVDRWSSGPYPTYNPPVTILFLPTLIYICMTITIRISWETTLHFY
ncbi:hypothetical protein QCA50_017768 [Cerrena zonata]|uniref:Uncharacterized protein n=1 Tax=Cerrena zonata TaxID=2478898 RepID=A0AAW0FJI1_9APHY